MVVAPRPTVPTLTVCTLLLTPMFNVWVLLSCEAILRVPAFDSIMSTCMSVPVIIPKVPFVMLTVVPVKLTKEPLVALKFDDEKFVPVKFVKNPPVDVRLDANIFVPVKKEKDPLVELRLVDEIVVPVKLENFA